MSILKITLLALAIFSLVSIVIALVQMGMVLKNKGKVKLPGWYFTVYSILLSLSAATLVIIW